MSFIQTVDIFAEEGGRPPFCAGHGFYPQRMQIDESLPPIFQNGALLFYVASGRGGLTVNVWNSSWARGASDGFNPTTCSS